MDKKSNPQNKATQQSKTQNAAFQGSEAQSPQDSQNTQQNATQSDIQSDTAFQSPFKATLKDKFRTIVKSETFPGVLLIIFTLLALLCQNTLFSVIYENFLHIEISFEADFPTGETAKLSKSLLHWINDGLITIFFLCIGLELKYEVLCGQLRNIRAVSLPIFGALGGMAMPALIFTLINLGDSYALRGWAIPTATDIAFGVGVLMLLGSRVPSSLKLFLLSLAIFDDLGAILIIALFYTGDLSFAALVISALCICGLGLLNYLRVSKLPFYFILGVFLWLSMLQSGVHATLAGVIVSLFIPLERKNGEPFLKALYADLSPWVNFFILPLFAFANAGVDLRQMDISQLFNTVSIGIFLGLFLGKQLGVFTLSWLSIKVGLAHKPANVSWTQFYGICIVTGIGFTMSLFVDGLAYANPAAFGYTDRLAVLLASLTSGVVGYCYLRFGRFKENV